MGTLELQKLIISIHAPAKGATSIRYNFKIAIIHFNPRSREGSDESESASDEIFTVISIHAPAKGATLQLTFCHCLCLFQSTLPRRERLDFLDCFDAQVLISIHAPAKGATH